MHEDGSSIDMSSLVAMTTPQQEKCTLDKETKTIQTTLLATAPASAIKI